MKKNNLIYIIQINLLFLFSCHDYGGQVRKKKINLGELFENNYTLDSSDGSYINDSLNFELKYPISWIVEDCSETSGIFLAHVKNTSQFNILTNFSVQVTQVAGAEPLDSLFATEMQHLRSKDYPISEVKIEFKDKIIFAEQQAIMYLASGKYEEHQKIYDLKWKKILFIKEKYLYDPSSTSTIENFEQDTLVINEIFDSFNFFLNKPNDND